MVLNIKMQMLLSRYFPFTPFWICLIGGLLFVNSILEYHILNDFNAGFDFAEYLCRYPCEIQKI